MPHTFFSRQTRRRIKSALTILRRAWKRDSASLVILCEEQNKRKDCPFFGTICTPEHPIGAPMVSSEGVCAAYYRYK